MASNNNPVGGNTKQTQAQSAAVSKSQDQTPTNQNKPSAADNKISKKLGFLNNIKPLTVLIVAVLALLIGGGAFYFFNARKVAPSDIRVTNVTSNSATVTWTTKTPSPGMVIYSEKDNFLPLFLASLGKEKAYDDRDYSKAELAVYEEITANADSNQVDVNSAEEVEVKNQDKYYVHHVTLRNLDAQKQYYFKVGNGSIFSSPKKQIATDFSTTQDNSFQTFAELENMQAPNPSYGSVVDQDGSKVSDGILFMVINSPESGSLAMSSVLNAEGRWYVDLSNARKSDGTSFGDIDEMNDTELIFVDAGPLGESVQIENDPQVDAPAKDIVISSDNQETSQNKLVSKVFACPYSTSKRGDACFCVAPGGTEWQISICDCAGTDDHPHCGGSGGGAEQDNENEEAEQDDTPSQEPSVTNPDCSDTECSYRGTCYDNNQKPADYWCCNGEWSSEKCAAIRAVEEENTNQEELSNEYSDDGTGSECDPDGDWPQCDGSNTNSKTCNNGYVEWTTCTSGCNPDTGNCNPSQAPECNHRNYTDQCTSDGNVKKCNLNGQFVISNCQGGCHNGDCQNGVDLDPTDQTENHGPGRGSINKFITKTLAATYTVDDNIILTPTQDGVYNIDIPGEGSATNVKLSADEPYFFYVDENGNDQQDENEEAIDLNQYSVELEVSDDIELFEIELSQGLNYISFEYLPDNTDSCKLIKEINDETDVLVTMISRFESGDFESTSFREDTDDPVSGACFPVIPGRGYVIRALEEPTDSVGLQGYKLLAPAEVSFDSPGWHLIGVNGNGKSYTADSLIDSIDELNEEIDADNVTRWEKSRDMYLGLQKETTEEGEENVYGFDFPIKSKTAYFVRTISGAGVWTPE